MLLKLSLTGEAGHSQLFDDVQKVDLVVKLIPAILEETVPGCAGVPTNFTIFQTAFATVFVAAFPRAELLCVVLGWSIEQSCLLLQFGFEDFRAIFLAILTFLIQQIFHINGFVLVFMLFHKGLVSGVESSHHGLVNRELAKLEVEAIKNTA